jgi:hypothetical protein
MALDCAIPNICTIEFENKLIIYISNLILCLVNNFDISLYLHIAVS